LLLDSTNDPDRRVTYQAFRELRRFADDPRVINRILALLSQPGTDRWYLIDVLGYSHDPHVGDVLIGLLADPDGKVRAVAVAALVRHGDPRSVEPIIAMLHDLDVHVRLAAIEALVQFRDPRSVELLTALLHDQDRSIQYNAERALSRLNSQANWHR
jgi:HEAT repeat protein